MLRTLPGDDVRSLMWRFSDRFDLQMIVQSARAVARGPVARLVAEGERNTHEWTPAKASLLKAFDESGITAVFLDPEDGGLIEGPKNLALALLAFELAWVDAGAATSSLAGNLALAPIHECGTPEQKRTYMRRAAPAKPGEDRTPWRGSFALTEPLPYVGVETGVMCGKVRVAEWKDGAEPMLKVEKRGRFITNMGFANFVTAAVDTADDRIKSSCMIILEETDPGTWDRGPATKKLVHQLSSTNDPVLSVTVPASRIIGGYTIEDGKIVPAFSHGEVIEAVFKRTRVTVGLMTAAKLLSAVEPVIRYHRLRFRGGDASHPGTPRHDLGLQQKEDARLRLVDIWATGEAASSLGFATARLFDEYDAVETAKEEAFAKQGVKGPKAQMRALMRSRNAALELAALECEPEGTRNETRRQALMADPIARFLVLDAQTNVLCPACKLWATGVGATMMREAVALMGGYGITEDCPGFLPMKWADAQLEATYEGPEAVQRRQLSLTMVNEVFLFFFSKWADEARRIHAQRPGVGARSVAAASDLWLWTLKHLQASKDAEGRPLYHGTRQGVAFAMADALSWILAARFQILDVLELDAKGRTNASLSEGLVDLVGFFSDLSSVQAARAAGEAARICTELVAGFEDKGFLPEEFRRLRDAVDASLAGSRLAKDRAGDSVTHVMIPEALDYPA